MSLFVPAYRALFQSGELHKRAIAAVEHLHTCNLCPRACGVDRFADKTGACRTGRRATVVSVTPHFGEEPGISGSRGSGTIFFGYCNLACTYCQNHEISQPARDTSGAPEVTAETLAGHMIALQDAGCHNINFVTPSHVVPQILEALIIAAQKGLEIPLVYNSNGYDSLEALKLLDGVIDVYLPDLKYLNEEHARTWSGISEYPKHATAALEEMLRQVGYPEPDEQGIIHRGLVVRHLVLPGGQSDSVDVISWIARHLGKLVYVSLMSQYFPAHKVIGDAVMGRSVSREEYEAVVEVADRLGLENGWRQEPAAAQYYRPDFSVAEKPFEDIDDFIDDPDRK